MGGESKGSPPSCYFAFRFGLTLSTIAVRGLALATLTGMIRPVPASRPRRAGFGFGIGIPVISPPTASVLSTLTPAFACRDSARGSRRRPWRACTCTEMVKAS